MLNRLGLIKMGKHFLNSQDNAALKLLAPYMPEKYFPWSQNSIKPRSLLAFVNDIIINDRKIIVEFGSGISTIIISNMIEKLKLDKKLISFEHDENWIKLVKTYVDSDKVEFHKIDVQKEAPFTYKSDNIDNALKGLSVNSVLVDGPPAYNWERRRSRRSVINLFEKYLDDERYCVFLDDVNRPSEYKSIRMWGRQLKQKSGTVSNCIGFVVKGDHYSFK